MYWPSGPNSVGGKEPVDCFVFVEATAVEGGNNVFRFCLRWEVHYPLPGGRDVACSQADVGLVTFETG